MAKKRLLLLCHAFLASLILSAGPVGKISFLDGDMTLIRDGKAIAAAKVQEGFPVENMDTFITGANSTVEVKLDPKTGIGGSFRVSAKSSACLVLSDLKKEQVGNIELLAGSIAVKVNKMLGNTRLQVTAEVAHFGVRGTQFQIVTNPNGDLLLVTSEGRVECSDGTTSLSAEAGTAVEALRDEALFHKIAVPGDPAAFPDIWESQRLEVLKSDAPRAFQFYSAQYAARFDQMQKAYQRLMAEAGNVVALWEAQDRTGGMSDAINQIREKNAIVGPLFEVRGAFNFLDRFRFNLEGLRPYLTGRPEAAAFYQRLERDRKSLDIWIPQYRYLVKLYALRNDGDFPLDTMDDF